MQIHFTILESTPKEAWRYCFSVLFLDLNLPLSLAHCPDWKQKVSFAVNAQECGDILVSSPFAEPSFHRAAQETLSGALEEMLQPGPNFSHMGFYLRHIFWAEIVIQQRTEP